MAQYASGRKKISKWSSRILKPFELKALKSAYVKNLNSRQKPIVNGVLNGSVELKNVTQKMIDKTFIQCLLIEGHSYADIIDKIPPGFEFVGIISELIEQGLIDAEIFEEECKVFLENGLMSNDDFCNLKYLFDSA